MNKTRIWMIIPSYYPHIGGAELQLQRISQQLASCGYQVTVITRRHNPRYPYQPPTDEIHQGIHIHRVFSRGPNQVASILYVVGGFIYLWRNGRGGIYHAHDVGAPAWLANLGRYLLNGRSLVKLRSGRAIYEKMTRTPFYRWQFLTQLQITDHILVVSDELKGLLSEYTIPENKSSLLPNSVDLEYFRPPTPAEKIACRQKLNIPEGSVVGLYVGRLEYVKGVDLLIDAWLEVQYRLQLKASLYIIGDGQEKKSLQTKVSTKDVNASVIFTGTEENIRPWYWAADWFVLPSRAEGFSNALGEALACNLPAIASRIGGSLDVIKENHNGFLFTSENQADLSHNLECILQKRDQWAQMGDASRQIISQYANIAVTSQLLAKIYVQLLKNR